MKKCAFCPRRADSDEDVFSKWMLRMLPRKEQFRAIERVVATDTYLTHFQKRPYVKARAVCSSCNNNWMSVLENNYAKPAMEPLLFGNVRRVIPYEVTLAIAIYAFKTLVIAVHKDLKLPAFFTVAERVAFRRHFIIPSGVQIWMAKREIPAGKYRYHWESAYGNSQPKASCSYINHMCTWNFQNVILQILASKWQNKLRRNRVPIPFIEQQGYWSDRAIPVWPSNEVDIQWPPPVEIGDNAIKGFAERLHQTQIFPGRA
jgi:hypothetical protein